MSAFYMERLLNQNTYQAKQARYRGLKPIITNENDRKFELTNASNLMLNLKY